MLKSLANHLVVTFLKLLSILPYRLLVSIGYGLGYIAARIPGDRNRVVKTNLHLCFPKLNKSEIDILTSLDKTNRINKFVINHEIIIPPNPNKFKNTKAHIQLKQSANV